MRVTTMDRYEPAPGRVVEFVPAPATLAAAAGAAASPVPPSFNQRFHLATDERGSAEGDVAAEAGLAPGSGSAKNDGGSAVRGGLADDDGSAAGSALAHFDGSAVNSGAADDDDRGADADGSEAEPRGHWLACAFDLPPGPVDISALRAAFESWGRRHETLRSGFRARAGSAGPERYIVPAEAYELLPRGSERHAGTAELRDLLTRRLGATCRPLNWPSSFFAVVVRPSGGTVVCGFDHCNADAYTLAIAVHEIRHGYSAYAAGGAPVDLPKAGSYVDYCAEEALASSEGLAGYPDADQRVGEWAEFLTACGRTAPSFPLPLGVPAGQRAAQGTDTRRLLDPAAADAFERRCRSADGSAFAGLLTATALAARRLGGPDRLRLVTPLHTRYEERWAHAVGWFTTIAPVTVDVTGVTTVIEGLATTRAAFRTARTLAELPFAQVVPALGEAFHRTRDDVFMVSYVDYRRLPGAADHTTCNAHHISSVTTADDAQFWFSRTHEGLFLRSRFPSTPTAERSVSAFAAAVSGALTAT